MTKKKLSRKKGFTLFEMLAAIAILALLGIMITVGSNLATKSLNKSTYIANSSLLSDTVNKSMTDILRFSIPTEITQSGTVTFTCDAYGVIDGYFELDENGRIRINFGETTVHKNGTEVAKDPELIVNTGTYAGLIIKDLTVTYDSDDRVYTGTYTIRSEELDLEENCSFTVKPFDIKYQQGIGKKDFEDDNPDTPTTLCVHSYSSWTDAGNGKCYAECIKCHERKEKAHSVNLDELAEVRATITRCDGVIEHVFICERCGASVTKEVQNDKAHVFVYSIPTDADAAKDQHIATCSICNYSKQEGHFNNYTFTSAQHSSECVYCHYTDAGNHTFQYVMNETQHASQCTSCGYSTNPEAHTLSINSLDDYGHAETCSVCNYLSDPEEHNLVYTSNGESGHTVKCNKNCGYTKTESHAIKDEDLEHIDAVLLTLTECGMNGGSYTSHCKFCTWTKTEVIKSAYSDLSHDWTTAVKVSGNDTQHRATCNNCGKEDYTNHNFPQKPVDVDDDYGGQHAYVCTICNYQKLESHSSTNIVYTCNKVAGVETDTHSISCGLCGHEMIHTEDHSFTAYGYNETKHWTSCKYCGHKKTFQVSDKHEFVYKSDGTNHWQECSVCGYKKNVTAHSFVNKYDTTNHWQECSDSNCKFKKNNSVHTLGNYVTNGTQHWKQCGGCAYKPTDNHSITYKSDGTNHWEVCSICAYETTHTPHTFVSKYNNSTHWQECSNSNCGYKKNNSVHTTGNYISNGTEHWKKCSTCDYIESKAGHSFSYVNNGESGHSISCSVCKYNGGTEVHATTSTSNNSSTHTTKCSKCNYNVTKEHTKSYSSNNLNTHTTTCSICGYKNSKEDHEYFYNHNNSDKHWRECKYCHYERLKDNHNFKYSSIDSSKHKRTCSDCGYSIEENHNWGSGWFVSKNECKDCGYKK